MSVRTWESSEIRLAVILGTVRAARDTLLFDAVSATDPALEMEASRLAKEFAAMERRLIKRLGL